jgi:hypothetical protein
MSVLPPPIPRAGSSSHNATLLLFVVIGFFGGGVVGYRLSRAWAGWATQDPDWDGGAMGEVTLYIIIAVASVSVGSLGAVLSGYLGYRLQRRRTPDYEPNA